MSRIDKARAFRAKQDAFAQRVPDDVAATAPEMFPAWSDSAKYETGYKVRYGGLLYRCLTPHTAQASWTPAAAPSLWTRIDDPAIEWPDWRSPGSTNPYPLGAKVTHKGKRWISIHAVNVWEPGVSQWEEQK